MTISLSAVALREIVDLRIVFLGEGATRIVPCGEVGKDSPEEDFTMPLPVIEEVEPAEGERTTGDEGPDEKPPETPAAGADDVLMILMSKLLDVAAVLVA